ncbi:MAG TPA: cytochrome c oxidase assembly protein [Gaiellaceae bacterium]|nr:cytochrome c oxidase assembly protein [Gaiellaceae bacterium]
MSATSFSFEYVFLVLVAAAAVAYARAARHDRPSGARVALFALGLLLIAVPLNSPLETIAAKRLLMIHLLQNALIADIAPLFVLLGLTPGMRAWLNAHGARRLRARYALPAWLLAWYGTHIAGFYTWALETGWALNIEHAILIAGGLVFWWPLVSGRLGPPAALAYLGAGFVASSFLGLALIFASRPLYSFYETTPRLWGLSPVRDQNLGGILMNGEQTLVFLLAIGYYVWRLLEEEHVSGADRSPVAR